MFVDNGMDSQLKDNMQGKKEEEIEQDQIKSATNKNTSMEIAPLLVSQNDVIQQQTRNIIVAKIQQPSSPTVDVNNNEVNFEGSKQQYLEKQILNKKASFSNQKQFSKTATTQFKISNKKQQHLHHQEKQPTSQSLVGEEIVGKINPQVNRFWQNLQFNPGQLRSKEAGMANPCIPKFFQGPSFKEIFGNSHNCNCDQKVSYFLKKEIDDYRTSSKHLQYNKKDLMIRMLIDEVEKQHKRITFLENKVQEQKLKILKLEDALFDNRSHRLLIRCTSSNQSKREFIYPHKCNIEGGSDSDRKRHQERCLSAHQKRNAGSQSSRKNLKIQQYVGYQEGDELNNNLYEQYNSEQKQLFGGEKRVRIEEEQVEQKDEEVQIYQENQEQQQEEDNIVFRESIVLKNEEQKLNRLSVNKKDLLEDIFGEEGNEKVSNQVKANVMSFISDFQNCLQMLKELNKVLEYEAAPPPSSKKKAELMLEGGGQSQKSIPIFHQILQEFSRRVAAMVNCEEVLLTMVDLPTQELIQFTLKELLKHKMSDIFQPGFQNIENMEMRICANNREQVNEMFNISYLLQQMQIKCKDIRSLQVSKFQVAGKQGLAFQINSMKEQSFTQQDHEITQHLSSGCLRKLNRERDGDTKMRLIQTYKELLKIGINLYSRSTLASLIYEAERKLRELMGVKNVVVIVLDNEQDVFIKLNQELAALESEITAMAQDKSVQSHLIQASKIFLSTGAEQINQDSHLIYGSMRGLALIAIEQKKTLLVTDPLSYKEYDETIDLKFDKNKVKPIICVPLLDREEQRVVGCIELEFKMKNYLSSNPLIGGAVSGKQFKLDVLTRETLEIFANYLRTSIERLNVFKQLALTSGLNVSSQRKQNKANYSIAKLKKDKLPKKPYDMDELFLSIGNASELILNSGEYPLRKNQVERGEAAYQGIGGGQQ